MNEHTHSESTNSAIAGFSMFVAGAALGAATALVLAPASGRDTRAFLRRRSNEMAQDVRRRGNEAAHDAVTRGRDALRAQSERMTSAISVGWRRAGEAFRHSREMAAE